MWYRFRQIARSRSFVAAVTTLWLAAIGWGLALSIDHDARPSSPSTPPPVWPPGSTVARTAKRATLLMFVHPYCPCTRASIAELARVLEQTAEPVSTHILFIKPDKDKLSIPDDSESWNLAREIPGADLRWDDDSREAKLFQAKTSGQILLYDARGRLTFKGGITASRGHAGPSRSSELLTGILQSAETSGTEAPVFGCSLFSPARECCNKRELEQ